MTADQFKMPIPDRTRPLRGVINAYRRSEPGGRRKTRGLLTSSEDVVLEAVKLGYKIADEQILKGQDWARRMRNASLRRDDSDIGTLVDQGLRLARQFAVLLVELSETGMQAPNIARNFARQINEGPQPTAGQAPVSSTGRAHKPAGVPHTVPIEVRSERPACVTLVLNERLNCHPDVFPLYRKGDRKTHPLQQVKFRELPSAAGYCLSVKIPADQPAGTYEGYAVRPEDGSLLGVIKVEVSSSEHSDADYDEQPGEEAEET